MGAHPLAPSRIRVGARWLPLDELIASAPAHELGEAVSARLGPQLPFLMKILAADQPLSLQAHPNLEQAREGFDAEESRGIPRDAPNRCYRDKNHKPELLCALSRFDALFGFRPEGQCKDLFAMLDAPELQALRGALDRGGLRGVFTELMSLADGARERVVSATVASCARLAERASPLSAALRWVARLGRLYPNDTGVVSALLLNLVELEPGDAIFLPAGNLHAYLGGVGVEIMASSDNVLRGGLTPKHVDVAELLRVLDFSASHPRVLRPRSAGAERIWDTPAAEFRLSRIELAGSTPFEAQVSGPEIVLVTEGSARLESREGGGVQLGRGAAAFVSAGDGGYELSGEATLFRASVP